MPGAPASLVSWWRFEGSGGTISDSAGSNHGVLSGGSRVAGQVGNAIRVDGLADYANIPNDPTLEPNNISLEALLKPTDSRISVVMSKAYKKDGTWNPPYISYGFTQINLDLECSVTVSGTRYTAVKVGAFTLGAYTHAVLTYDGNNLKLYIDSNLEDTTPIIGVIDYNETSDFTMGMTSIHAPAAWFEGDIDEVALYNDDIGLAQVQSNYTEANAGRPYFTLGSAAPVIMMNMNSREGI